MTASALPMDAPDASDLSKRRDGGSLAVNKSSGKISKGIRRPTLQPRPPPTVYKIEAGEFRTLVQELTGIVPKPIGNSRLQRFSTSPLRPTFSYPKFWGPPNLQQFSNSMSPASSPTNGQRFSNIPFNGFGPAPSPLSQRINSFPTMLSSHTFSPLPALSPSDQLWANHLQSPNSATLRHLAESIVSRGGGHQGGDTRLDSSNNGGVVETAAAAYNAVPAMAASQPYVNGL